MTVPPRKPVPLPSQQGEGAAMIIPTNKTPMPFLSEFLTTSFQNVRSKERTDRLHKAVLNEILNVNPEFAELRWEFEYELPEDSFGGTFDLDIVGFDDNDEIKVIILDKAYQSNIGKNMKNYANTSVGESARVFFSPLCQKVEKILFVNVMPRVAPKFKTNGTFDGFDDVVNYKKRCKIDDVLDRQYDGVVKVIDLYYDIENVTEQKNKADYNVINALNLTPMPVV